MRIMITGGGTGGHTSPALAVIEELRRRDSQLLLQWVGCKGKLEESICERSGIPFRSLPVSGWPRRFSLRRVWVGIKLLYSFFRASLYIRAFQPQLVLGVGGYVSLPLMWTAQRLGVPTVIHEQNKTLGLANRMLAHKADRIYLSYSETVGNYPDERAIVVGNPVRSGFIDPPDKNTAREALGLSPDLPTVLVCGGSQGAHTINVALMEALSNIPNDLIQVIWMTGKSDFLMARTHALKVASDIRTFPYIDDMPQAFAAADLIVSRAGASSTAEIAAMAKPSLLIPYPHATDNHQEQNARAFEDKGAAVCILDKELSGELLKSTMLGILNDTERLDRMSQAARTFAKPVAAESIVEDLMQLVFGTEKSSN